MTGPTNSDRISLKTLLDGEPLADALEEWNEDGIYPALCRHGCEVEVDGICEHGCPSAMGAVGI